MLSAEIVTEKGTISVDLFSEQTPITVANFVNLASRGFYDNLNFHRVIQDFMIQVGVHREMAWEDPVTDLLTSLCPSLDTTPPGSCRWPMRVQAPTVLSFLLLMYRLLIWMMLTPYSVQ